MEPRGVSGRALPAEPGRVLWSVTIPGRAAHELWADRERWALLVSDGWGVAFGALRLRALSFADGSELASVRLGNQVRCVTRASDGSLLAATDGKLFRLDRVSLAERARWTERVPKQASQVLEGRGHAVLCNWLRPSVASLNLGTGAVRSRRTGGRPSLFALDDETVLVAAGEGALFLAGWDLARPPRQVAAVPAFRHADLDPSRRVWLALGAPVITASSVGPGEPATRVVVVPIDAPASVEERVSPIPFWQHVVAPEGGLAWVTTGGTAPSMATELVALRLPDLVPLTRICLPAGFGFAGLCAASGLAWATRALPAPRSEDARADLACIALPRPGAGVSRPSAP